MPLDISADGSTIVGSGKDSNNNTVGFVLKLTPTVLGVEEVLQVENKISFYPNPVKDVLNISSISLINKAVVYSITGQVVFQKEISGNNTTMNLSGLNSGIYIVQVAAGSTIQSFKFIKE